MTKKNFFLIFLFFAAIYWFIAFYGYGIYIRWVDKSGWSQVPIMRFLICIGVVVCVCYFLSQVLLLKIRKSHNIGRKVFFNLMGILVIVGSAFLVSMKRNSSSGGLVKAFIDGRNDGSLFYVLSRILDAEGLDIMLCSFLSFISGRIIYKNNILKTFLSCLIAWLLIISVNELTQKFLTLREGELTDIFANMTGISIALIISLPWFWKK